MVFQIAFGYFILNFYPDFFVSQIKNTANEPTDKTFSAHIEVLNSSIKSQPSQSSSLPSKKLIKTRPTNKIKSLEDLNEKKNPLEIHNKALNLLKNYQKEEALLLLKRNFYQNFFLPSYFILSHLEVSIFFSPFLWHIGLIFFAFICLFLLLLSFNDPASFHPKFLFFFLTLGFVLSSSESLLLKKRVSSSQEMDLRTAPFIKAPIIRSLSPNSDLIVLKQTGDWLAVQGENNQIGWLEKQKVFQIF